MFGVKTFIQNFFMDRLYGLSLTNEFKIRALMQFFKADEYGHRANTSKADLGYGWIHYGLIRQIKPHTILCIGSRHGFIPAVLAQACKDNGFGHVYFVDAGYGDEDSAHWTGVGYWKTNKGKQVFARFGLQAFISLFVMTTKEFAKKYPKLTFDYVYIDGDHSYKGVKYDFATFWPRLKQGGFLAFHDIDVKEKKMEGEYGVYKLWNKLKKQYCRVVFPFEGSGLGLIQKC